MSTMDNKSNYQDDLAGIKGMPQHPKDSPFIVPSNYFQDLEDKIMERIEVIDRSEKSLTVPPAYFDTLAQRIMERIDKEESVAVPIVRLSDDVDHPFLEKLKEVAPTSGFTVPDYYFEKLNTTLQQHLGTGQGNDVEEFQKIIPLNKRKSKFTSWLGYIAAACIAVSLGTYTFFQLQTPTMNSFEKELNAISDSEIVSYLEYYSEPGDGAIFEAQFEGEQGTDQSNFSKEDIEAYLDYSI